MKSHLESPRPLRQLGGFALLLSVIALAIWKVEFLNEIPSHLADAHRIADRSFDPLGIYRLPVGYSGLIALFLPFLAEGWAVKAVNALSFSLFLVLSWKYMEKRAEVAPRFRISVMTILTGMVALHPYTIATIVRSNESVVTAVLLLGFLLAVSGPPSWRRAIASGALIGLLMHVRANAVSLLACTGGWLLLDACRNERRVGRASGMFLASLLSLAAVYAMVGFTATGSAFYRPTNGGYNLYAGNNPYSAREIIRNQNAEYSLGPALREAGYPAAVDPKQVPQDRYFALAAQFASAHPGEVVSLTIRKAILFVSPRLANANSAPKVALQVVALLPFLAGLAVVASSFARRRRWTDGVLLLLALFYAAPFWITNADPRMRFPIDLVILVRAILIAAEVVTAKGGWHGAWHWLPGPGRRGTRSTPPGSTA